MEEKLKQIFCELGLYIDNNEYNEQLDLDSITFITLVARVEEDFGIRIPDDKFTYEQLSSFGKFIDVISEVR